MESVKLSQSKRIVTDRIYNFEIFDRGLFSLVVCQTEETTNGKLDKSRKFNLIFSSEYIKKNIHNEDLNSWIFLSADEDRFKIVSDEYWKIYKDGNYNWAGEDYFIGNSYLEFNEKDFENAPLERFVRDNEYSITSSYGFLIGLDGKPIHRKIWVGCIASMIASDRYCLDTVKSILLLNPKISNFEIDEIPPYNRDNSRQKEGISFLYDPDQEEFEELCRLGDFDFGFNLMKNIKKGLGAAEKDCEI